MRTLIALSLSLFVMSCASTTPGARPLDMSASAHDAVANQHESEASAHADQYDPQASTNKTTCGRGTKSADTPCWTSSSNPTAEHLKAAKDHQKMAADHRAASKAPRDAEAQACAGLTDSDRDESPFVAHRDDIASATRLDATTSNKGDNAKLAGASITVRAVPGLTKEYLQRVVDCHIARNAAMGFAMPEMTQCPLAVKGARATVKSDGSSFPVEIRADDADAATEVLKRALSLAPGT